MPARSGARGKPGITRTRAATTWCATATCCCSSLMSSVVFLTLLYNNAKQQRPSPCPLPIGWGEGGRRPGEGKGATFTLNGYFCDYDTGFGARIGCARSRSAGGLRPRRETHLRGELLSLPRRVAA